ncbi:putative iron-regulated membrane protein [Mariniflexile fucanivorans]|uniref:Putative iron-regulated membrane protein n=1 Tax=Mariniflexile fucanivorans TaxID=264023 RepID=A0A4R1RIW1_9FLAO|nr:PepSY-associated TM helix domain-containing protein [Mariniflexile fucanivorans]TCL65602.1 putative iron-regulated membrane protein [Mariniflexile fucanivorans]
MLSFNTTIRKIHLWLGLTCGLIASFSGLTGSLYVWQPEITAALNPELLQVENIENIKEGTILKSAVSLIETRKDRIDKIFLPYREQQTIAIQFKNGKTNYYHPVTSESLGEKSVSISFFESLLNLHRTLGIPLIGKYIIGTSAIIFFLILITSGVYIWWKAYANNLRKGIKVKWKAKKRKFNFDLHKALGIYFFIPLLIIAFTGSYFTFNSTYKSVLKVFNSQHTNLIKQQKNENFSSLNETLLNSNKGYALRAIYFPKDKTDKYRLRYIKNRFIKAGYRKTKEVEITKKGDITTLSDFRFDSNSNRIAAQFYPIHIGEIAGVFGRILVFISGVVPLVLFITGFRMYRLKKKKGLKRKALS